MNATATQPAFDQVADSRNLSQLIRSNAPDYWRYMKDSADLKPLRRYLPFEGAVAGDPHMGNFAPLPVTTIDGRREMRFVNVDFDDSGHGPFVLDYLRYVIAVKSLTTETTRRMLQDAYLAGLAGKKAAAPQHVQKCLAMSVSQYDEMAAKYAAQKSTDAGFKLKKGEIEPYVERGNPKLADIRRLFSSQEVIAIARRIESRGGSIDQLRIWVLVQPKGGPRRIVELKERSKPGTACYCTQPPAKRWLAEIRQAFWPGLTGAEYNLITLDSKLFWIRGKEVSLINVPYSSQKKHEREFVVALAVYDANILGLAHGNHPQSEEYRRTIKKDPDRFHEATKSIGQAYLKLARSTMEHQ